MNYKLNFVNENNEPRGLRLSEKTWFARIKDENNIIIILYSIHLHNDSIGFEKQDEYYSIDYSGIDNKSYYKNRIKTFDEAKNLCQEHFEKFINQFIN